MISKFVFSRFRFIFASTFISCLLLQRSNFHKGKFLSYDTSWRITGTIEIQQRENKTGEGCGPIEKTLAETALMKIKHHPLKLQWQNQYSDLSENYSVLIYLDLRGLAPNASCLIRRCKMYTIILVLKEYMTVSLIHMSGKFIEIL